MDKIVLAETQYAYRGNTKTSHRKWITAAIELLISEGSASVKIDRIAKKLTVTRGGFYGFFKNRNDLIDQLINAWQLPANDPFTSILDAADTPPLVVLTNLTQLVIEEKDYKPAFDSAMRDWARTSKRAKAAVELVDERRIDALRKVYLTLGEPEDKAFIRARIYYYHQVGYYAMEVEENTKDRLKYQPIYFKFLTGYDIPE